MHQVNTLQALVIFTFLASIVPGGMIAMVRYARLVKQRERDAYYGRYFRS